MIVSTLVSDLVRSRKPMRGKFRHKQFSISKIIAACVARQGPAMAVACVGDARPRTPE
jgi:hypothetical protein